VSAVIEFQHVTKIYKRMFSEEKLAALSDVSFEMPPGQVCAFLGPNGAGKTTTVRALGTLIARPRAQPPSRVSRWR